MNFHLKLSPYVFIYIFSTVVQAGNISHKQLKHRGFAGFSYRAVNIADVDSLNLSDTEGIFVRRVFPHTPAARSGIRKGDIIKKYDDNIISDISQFLKITRLYYAGDRIEVSLLRNGKTVPINLVLDKFPEETNDEIKIEYTSFANQEVMFRAVVTSPLNSENTKLPALLIVSALGSPRLIGVPNYSIHRALAHAAAKQGIRVLRFELRGYGDSEGEDYRTTDFNTELKDNLVALDYLLAREDVDPSRVFIFGHSTGGIIAASLASKRQTAGLITSCTIGRTFYERLVETVRLQSQLAGDSEVDIDKKIKDYLLFTVSIARGDSLPEILSKNPELTQFVNNSNRIMDDRTVAYWRQQLNLNLSELYNKITEPVLIIYAASDFLTQLACHEHIRDVLTGMGNTDVTFSVIPNLDHRYSYAKTKNESYENYKTNNFIQNPKPYRQMLEWMSDRVKNEQKINKKYTGKDRE